MKDSIQLSILLTTHAKSEHFTALLEKVLSFTSPMLEIIIINDAADVVTTQFIERKARKSANSRVYIYEHSEPAGRGGSLNEALLNASGSLIWAPLRADRLNESLMVEAVRRFRGDPAAFWVLDHKLPEHPLEWLRAAEEGELPDDSCLIWNRSAIDAEQFFFNPFMNQLHGAELALRLKENKNWYRTDPFFVVSKHQAPYISYLDIREFLYTSLRLFKEPEEQKGIIKEIENLESRKSRRVTDDEYLLEGRQFLREGDAKRSLELIDRFLKRNPDHPDGLRIKVAALEKLRRHVEAAELKHNLQLQSEDFEEAEFLSLIPDGETSVTKAEETPFEVSVVIPTTGHGKNILESALIYLQKAADPLQTELIIVDNASIDDTFDYLEQLKGSNFLNIRVITNHVNSGFAASVNMGIGAASSDYVLVMHNDVILKEDTIRLLRTALEESAEAGLAAPAVRDTHILPQRAENDAEKSRITADKVDSCCFMIRKSHGVLFDEEYGLCYFEMEDYCKQLVQNGLKLVIEREAVVDHSAGTTINMMGLELTPELKWQNRSRFYQKWRKTTPDSIPEGNSHPDRFLKLGAPDNPLNPGREWVELIHDYLTNEVRTEILRGEWTEEELLTIVLTLLIADERELLRTMEDKLQNIHPDRSLLTLFIVYYFRKNIYSRCRHYMAMDQSGHPLFDYYDLRIKVADKEFEDAVPILNDLLGLYPSCPDLYQLAGEIYEKTGETGEAKSFFAMAGQLDPYRFHAGDEAFDLHI